MDSEKITFPVERSRKALCHVPRFGVSRSRGFVSGWPVSHIFVKKKEYSTFLRILKTGTSGDITKYDSNTSLLQGVRENGKVRPHSVTGR